MQLTKEERFREFLTRLINAPRASSHDEALALLSQTLNDVEDEFSEIPCRPEEWQTDGRMYPPRKDNARDVPGREDVIRYRHRSHNTFIRDNGAIEIRDLHGLTLLEKPGADGRGVELE
jgi:hypothetical protein